MTDIRSLNIGKMCGVFKREFLKTNVFSLWTWRTVNDVWLFQHVRRFIEIHMKMAYLKRLILFNAYYYFKTSII